MKPEISELKIDEIGSYSGLIKEVYDEYVAIDYPEEGNRTFYSFISEDAILERMKNKNFMICAKSGGAIIAAHEIRDKNHIALFFVKKEYHNMGIGRSLFDHSLTMIKNRYPEIEVITVNSSPYALNIYKKMGFIQKSEICRQNGIKFYPMEFRIK